MKYCIVELYSQTATFRNPEFQNYHKTFALPPPTTLVGLAGAAMGLSPNAAQDFFSSSSFQMGIYGQHQGKTTDLWKYDAFKNRSIVLREILIGNHFVLVYGSEEEEKVELLATGFAAPVYALTMGSSDSLAKVIHCEVGQAPIVKSTTVAYCLLAGDIIKEVMQNASAHPEFSIYATTDPIALDVPTHFQYESDYGARSVSQRQLLSFIGREMELNVKKEGIQYQDKFIPLFDYNSN
ncbi:CRISPR-associated protein Cas5 [Lewinella sp. LCG006]|uniref:CRISPR-associated protein Cas5 n=1 Tax=Lewinella sp. LCG006 TaxID=3231911 RepID=UPI00345FBA44